LNRPMFEKKLRKNIISSIREFGKVELIHSKGRIYIEPKDDNYDFVNSMNSIKNVFGVVSVSKVYKIKSDFEEIKNTAKIIIDKLADKKQLSFKVQTRRGNKNFELDSMQISCEIGAFLLDEFDFLRVDVHNPDLIMNIEVRDDTYLYTSSVKAYGGLPVGTNGKGVVLLSGGIDSPVAGWMMAKRGLQIEAVHFYSYPYTSERSKEKVVELAKIMSKYTMGIKLHIVPFTEIQEFINDNFPHEYITLIMRRVMMKIAEKIASMVGAEALITGESMGQVASQTLKSIVVTNSVVKMPVFRPLIGMDKLEVIDISVDIGTYNTSILPYEDCCTVFVAKHPKTNPKMEKIIELEKNINFYEMEDKAINDREVINL